MKIERIRVLDGVFDQLKMLHKSHWDETEAYRNSEFSPRYDLLVDYWNRGLLLIWGLFNDTGDLVGHLSMYVTTSVHTGEMIATEDALYVLPEYRKGYGAALSRQMLSDIRKVGVSECWATCKPATRVGMMLKRLGFSHVADTYLIRLKDKEENHVSLQAAG
jgi:GNAT superfamily N-acetyltransferase